MTDSSTQQPREGASGVHSADAETHGSLRERVAGQAKDLVRTRMSKRTSQSATDLSNLAHALRQTSQQLEGNVGLPLVNRTADRIERVAELLDTTDPEEFVRRVENFARRDPLLFLGGAFALGLAGARFLKSSATQEPSAAASSISEPGMDFRP